MNKIERVIYDLIKNNLLIKKIIKLIYQTLFSLFTRSKVKINNTFIVANNYFFGFHDKSPWNYNDTLILAHKIDNSIKGVPQKEHIIEVGYFRDSNLKDYKVVGKTKAWNWQQGAMLQWLGKSDNIVFNSWNGERYVTSIVNLNGEVVRELPFSTGAISQCGRYFASYSFERLNRGMYGYGYANEGKELNHNILITENDGFIIYDIESNLNIVDKSIHEINEILGDEKFMTGYLFLTHFIFSNNAKKVLFLLRSYEKGRRLKSRLIVYSLCNDQFKVIQTGNMVSHLTWQDDKILAYCTNSQEKEGYFLFESESEKIVQIGESIFKSDGHPQYNSNNGLFVTDTYPNRGRIQSLMVYSIENSKGKLLGNFYSPFKYSNEFRCDLHPRWNRKGNKICIDTTYTGERSLCIIDYNK